MCAVVSFGVEFFSKPQDRRDRILYFSSRPDFVCRPYLNNCVLFALYITYATQINYIFLSFPLLRFSWTVIALAFIFFGFSVENQNSASSLFFDSFRIPFWPSSRSVHPFSWSQLWNAVFAACFEHSESFCYRHRQMNHFLIHAMMSNESFTCEIFHCFGSCASQQQQH